MKDFEYIELLSIAFCADGAKWRLVYSRQQRSVSTAFAYSRQLRSQSWSSLDSRADCQTTR